MKQKRWIIILVVFFVILGIGVGVKRYMEKQELVEIQKDLADYLYNNYHLYTVDKEKDAQLNKEYNRGNGNLTTEEFLKKSDELKEYSDIEKIEFTGFSVGPMNNLKVSYTVNDVIKKETSLDTISAETNKLIYRIGEHSGEGPYYLEKKSNVTTLSIPQDIVIYYHGGIN